MILASMRKTRRHFISTRDPAELERGWRWTFWGELTTGSLAIGTWVFWPAGGEIWVTTAAIEACLTMATLTLTDIATRLEKKPSLLVGLLISLGVGLLYLGEIGAAFAASVADTGGGWLASVLGIWTIGQRAHIVWTMPQGDALDRMRHRALAGDRAFLLLLLAAATFALAKLTQDWSGSSGWNTDTSLITLAYAILAFFTAWRSRYLLSPRFAAKPRAFLYDILGVDYLAPL